MKKIIALCLMLVVVFTISACGPNSNYYKVETVVDVKSGEALEVDPYQDILVKHMSEFDIKLYKHTQEPKKYYEVEVEYQEVGSHEFKEFDLKDSMIYEEDPYQEDTTLKMYHSYNFKVRFINTATNLDEDTIQFYVVYTFMPATEAKAATVDLDVNTAYNVLDNIVSKDETKTARSVDQIKEAFDIEVEVKQGETSYVVNNIYEVIFDTPGTYHVVLELTEKSGVDGEASATASGAKELKEYTIEYDIIVEG